jgi:hypothetical protein
MWVVKKTKEYFRGGVANARTATTITLGDRGREFRVALPPDLPDDAYQRLFHIDLSFAPSGVLTWDHQLRDWHVA